MAWNDELEEGTPAYSIARSESKRIKVIAGPGTGKSFAMKRRVARLLEEGVSPKRILAVTFTRVAAEDLHRELVGLGVAGASDLRGWTLHGLAMSVLMRRNVLASLERYPRLLNEFELDPLLKDLSKKYGNKRQQRGMLRGLGAGWARMQNDELGFVRIDKGQQFLSDVVDWLRLHDAMLMDEVIPLLLQYLRANPGCLELKLYDHILIDEYQDLNRAEQEVLALLGQNASVCIIGDDDQSIYGFKHAYPEGIRTWGQEESFEKIEINECRRCPTTVVKMANKLISLNSDRSPGAMDERSENGEGEIVVRQYSTADMESLKVSEKISALVESGVQPGEIIVLAQRKAFANPIYSKLQAKGIPARSYYAETILDNSVAQERLALLKLFLNNEDKVALRWLLGFGSKDWKNRSYARILQYVKESGQSQWEILNALFGGALCIPHTSRLIKRFTEIQSDLNDLARAEESGLVAFVSAWLPNREETPLLLNEVEKIIDDTDTLNDLLEKLQESITRPEVPTEVEGVRIMSLHKSKGLSAPFVFIMGCVEGLIPTRLKSSATPNECEANIQENRRLFYVGITRVKYQSLDKPGYLALSYPQFMPMQDAKQSGIEFVHAQRGKAELRPSRFLSEMAPYLPPAKFDVPL